MTLPATKSLDLYRGDTYPLAARLWSDPEMTAPVDLSDVVPHAQLRTDPSVTPGPVPEELILEMTCVVELPNVIHVTIDASSWPAWAPAAARWDLELTYPSGAVRTILAGRVRIIQDVTVAP